MGNTNSTTPDEHHFVEEVFAEARVDFDAKYWQAPSHTSSLSDYERLKTLGTGTFGRVVLSKFIPTGDYYALKIVEKDRVMKTKQLKHMLNEKRVLQAVKFPFIVALHSSFKNNSNVYLALEFVPGGEMFSIHRRMGHFPEAHSRFYACQIVLAFEYLHAMDIAYRDLKPENILIDAMGYIKLIDFGFAKRVKRENRTYTMCGTPEYIAPEVILSKGHNRAVDWWALGVLVYEMVAGHPPFVGENEVEMYENIVAGKVCGYSKRFGPDLKDLIANLLQVDLSRRFGNLKSGIRGIKDHPWFAEIDWIDVYEKKVVAPYVPKILAADDTKHFDTYSEETVASSLYDKWTKEFADF